MTQVKGGAGFGNSSSVERSELEIYSGEEIHRTGYWEREKRKNKYNCFG